jgi:transcriptional regulator with XRE-family HTH domain
MAKQKFYAGTKLRELRRKVDLTQREFSERLEVSLPYLNQMENNNRPVSAAVILALADVFGFDVTELVSGDNARLVSDMREAATGPNFWRRRAASGRYPHGRKQRPRIGPRVFAAPPGLS